MLRAALLWLVLACAAPVLAQNVGAGDTAATDAAGTVEFVEGDVRVFDKAKLRRTVKVGDAVNEGDGIVTGGDGEIHLNMADGGLIAVRPNTKMRIARFRAEGGDADQGIFGLLAGSLRSVTGWIGRYNPRGYQIRTPTAAIGVRGTDHEPLVIAPGDRTGDPGTYDKVNAGATYIQTQHGRVDVPAGRAAFAPHGKMRGRLAPRLLDRVPAFYRPTRNEARIERRHEAIQKAIEQRREERRKFIGERKAQIKKRQEERKKALEDRRSRERQAQEQRRRPDDGARPGDKRREQAERREERRREMQDRRRKDEARAGQRRPLREEREPPGRGRARE